MANAKITVDNRPPPEMSAEELAAWQQLPGPSGLHTSPPLPKSQSSGARFKTSRATIQAPAAPIQAAQASKKSIATVDLVSPPSAKAHSDA